MGDVLRTAYYHWMDFYTKVWYSTRCEVLEEGAKTAVIRLLECSRGGALPGTELRLRVKSITPPPASDDSTCKWKRHCYFD